MLVWFAGQTYNVIMRKGIKTVFGVLLFLSACAAPPSENDFTGAGSGGAGSSGACVMKGKWIDPATGSILDGPTIIADMARRPVVLLGETHNNPDHHRWQLQTIAALHTINPNMVLAFESFPRRVQPILDSWVKGKLGEKDFLKQVGWNDIWRFDPSFYMPLFHFARMNNIPMVAMNVDRSLISRISKVGWKGVRKKRRQGVGTPTPASDAYVDFLAEVFGQHGDKNKPRKNFRKSLRFKRFIQVQLTWDRAMAEAIAGARNSPAKPLVVGIVGMGHLQYGYGIPYQLASLGIENAAVLLPWDRERGCDEISARDGTAIADALFGTDNGNVEAARKKPMLGVRIEAAKSTGLVVREVSEKSVAGAAGIAVDDIILEAAGQPVSKPSGLVEIIHRQAAGTWLPLKIRRDGKIMEIIAKFPPGT